MIADNMLIPTQDLVRLYRRGELLGAYIDSPALPSHIRKVARYYQDQFEDEQPFPLFATAPKQNWKAEAWKGQRAFLWHYWLQVDPAAALRGNQLTGDCVSWGERCKQDCRRAFQILAAGRSERYIKRQATCLLYSGRGHTGQGASPSQIANWATKCGILLEETFTDASGKKWDFTSYPNYVKIGIDHGKTGMPAAVIEVTRRNRVVGQSRVLTIPELCDGLFRGYAASVGFTLDTAPTGNPVSRLKGPTAHQTSIVGFDDTPEARFLCKQSLGYEDTVILYDQSWGLWNQITNLPEVWKPWGEGMYAHSAREAQRHLSEKECFVCTDQIIGFEGSVTVNNLLI